MRIRSLVVIGIVAAGATVIAASSFDGAVATAVVDEDELARGFVDGVDIFNLREEVRQRQSLRLQGQEEVTECMLRRGFVYEPTDVLGADSPTGAALNSTMNSTEFAQTFGFGIVPADEASLPDEISEDEAQDNADPVAEIEGSDAYTLALRGDSDSEGCDVGFDAVSGYGADYGDVDVFLSVLDMKEQFAAQGAVEQHYSEWSDCMASLGHEYTSPLDAHVSLTKRVGPNRTLTLSEEVEVASATVTCGSDVFEMLPETLEDEWSSFVRARWDGGS